MFLAKKYRSVILILIFSIFFETVNVNAENSSTGYDLELWDFDIKELEFSYNEDGFWGDTATIILSIINDSNQVASSDIHINLFSDNGRVIASNPELDIYHLDDMLPGETITRKITISDFDLSHFNALNVNITPPSQTHIFASELIRLDEYRTEKVNDLFLTIGMIIGIFVFFATIIGVLVRNSSFESFLPLVLIFPIFFIAGHIFGIPQFVSSLFFTSLGMSFHWSLQEMTFMGIVLGIVLAFWLHALLIRKVIQILSGNGKSC